MEKVFAILNFVLAVVMTIWLCACSVKFEVGYHGETAVEDKTFTAAKR